MHVRGNRETGEKKRPLHSGKLSLEVGRVTARLFEINWLFVTRLGTTIAVTLSVERDGPPTSVLSKTAEKAT